MNYRSSATRIVPTRVNRASIISSIHDLVINAIPIIEHDRIHRYEQPSETKRAGSFFTLISSSASSLDLLPLLRPRPTLPTSRRIDTITIMSAFTRVRFREARMSFPTREAKEGWEDERTRRMRKKRVDTREERQEQEERNIRMRRDETTRRE